MGKKVNEMAKLGQQGLVTAEKLGGWLDEAFGDGLRHIGEAFSDSMQGFKMRNRLRVLKKTEAAFAGSTNNRPLPPRIAFAVWEAIGEQDDESFDTIWANFLRNAADPLMPKPERMLVETIRALEPSDWPLLKRISELPPGEHKLEDLGPDAESTLLSLERFRLAGVLTYDGSGDNALTWGSQPNVGIAANVGRYFKPALLDHLITATQRAPLTPGEGTGSSTV